MAKDEKKSLLKDIKDTYVDYYSEAANWLSVGLVAATAFLAGNVVKKRIPNNQGENDIKKEIKNSENNIQKMSVEPVEKQANQTQENVSSKDATAKMFITAYNNDVKGFKEAIAGQPELLKNKNNNDDNVLTIAVENYEVGTMNVNVAEIIMKEVKKDPTLQKHINIDASLCKIVRDKFEEAKKQGNPPTNKDKKFLNTLEELSEKQQKEIALGNAPANKTITFAQAAKMAQSQRS